MDELLHNIEQCSLCATHLPKGVNPVVRAHVKSKIVVIGQAPGLAVHQSNIPWNDKSGERLRNWLGVSEELFYDERIFAIIPMGFCYPGKGKNGDLPPRKECTPKWHPLLFKALNSVELVILIGNYAQKYYLQNAKKTLTETVQNFHEYVPQHIVLPHPSPRNNIWLKKNPWFEKDNLPYVKLLIQGILSNEI